MTVIPLSEVDPRSAAFKRQLRSGSGPGAASCRRVARAAVGGDARARERHPRAGQAPAARAHRAAARSRQRRSSSCRSSRPTACTRTRCRAAGHHHRHRPRLRPRMRDRRQRRHGEGRHLLSDDREEASAGAGDRARRAGCPASTSSIPAAPICRIRTRSFPTAIISAASSSIRRRMSAAGIPQIAVVMGSCTAGGAYVPAMSDEADHRQEPGHDLPGRPAAREGRDRRGRRPPRSWAAPTCTRGSPGVADHLAESDAPRAGDRPADRARGLGARGAQRSIGADPRPPLSRPQGALRPDPEDLRQAARRAARSSPGIVDGVGPGRVQAALRCHARHRLRPTLRLSRRHPRQQRHPLQRSSAQKGAHFIELCCQRAHSAGLPPEHHGLHGRAGSTSRAASPRTGPKLVHGRRLRRRRRSSRSIGGSFGAGNYGMAGRAYGPRLSLDVAQCAHLGHGRRAGGVGAGHGQARRPGNSRAGGWPAEGGLQGSPSASSTSAQGHPYYATARLWDDGIIDPAETRMVLGLGLSAALECADPPTRFGVFRM